MKENDINLNDPATLMKFRSTLNETIDKRIEEATLNEKIKSIDQMPIYKMNVLFENISERLSETKKGQNAIGKYIKTVKGNKPLKEAYTIYNGITDASDVNDAYTYVSEAVNILKECYSEEYDKGVNDMRKVLKEAVRAAGITSEDFDKAVDSEKFALFESIDCLSNIKRNAGNVSEITKNMSNAVNIIKESSNKTEAANTIEETNVEDLRESLMDMYNSTMFESWENEAIKDIASYSLAGLSKEQLFEDYKDDCLCTLGSLINEAENTEEAARLSSIKESLEGKEYNEVTGIDDIMRLSELKKTINEDIQD